MKKKKPDKGDGKGGGPHQRVQFFTARLCGRIASTSIYSKFSRSGGQKARTAWTQPRSARIRRVEVGSKNFNTHATGPASTAGSWGGTQRKRGAHGQGSLDHSRWHCQL